MELLHSFLSEQMIERIGWVLVHFLWQGVAAAALMWCVMKALGRASSNVRYIAACAGLTLMVVAPAVTFMLIAPETPVAVVDAPVEPPVAVSTAPAVPTHTIVIPPAEPVSLPAPPFWEVFTANVESALPYCVIGWFVGVAVLSVWYLGGWCQLQKLRRIGTKAVTDTVRQTSSQLAQRLGLRRAVGIVESALVQVPTVVGWLKPVILLPATALTGLDEIQLKAMIAHELAHIKRCDYLVNIAQTVVEILGFYHPAVWWVSRQVRVERENACDDIAVNLLQNRKEYAKALFSMEAIRARQLDLAIAANGAPLTNRIRRLAGNETHNSNSSWIPSVVITLMVTALLITATFAMNENSKTKALPTKQETAELLVGAWRALDSRDSAKIDDYFYFENESLRQRALPYLKPELGDFSNYDEVHILDITMLPDDTYRIYTLNPMSPGEECLICPKDVVFKDGRYKLKMCTQEYFDKQLPAGNPSPEQIARIAIERDLNKWKNAEGKTLNELIQSQIGSLERALAAIQYAKVHNLKLVPLNAEEINKKLDKFRNTPSEKLKQEAIEKLSVAVKNPLEVINTELDPIAQGKNTLYVTVKNTSDTEQLLGVHIYTRSVDYGPDGIGWGTIFFETFQPGETKRARFVYKIQGPVTENTYVRIKYYNPASEAAYDYEKPFAEHFYKSSELQKRQTAQALHPATKAQFEEISNTLNTIQDFIRNRQYANAWDLFADDYQEAEYQDRGFEAFKKQMEPTHPLHSGFVWEKADFLKLNPLDAFTDNGTLKLQAACDDAQWTIDFVKEDDNWKINWIAGYTPTVIKAQPPEKTTEPPAATATLSNGVTVELLGVSEYPNDGKQWWKPDGTLLTEIPYDGSFLDIRSEIGEENRTFELALKFSGNMAGPAWEIPVERVDDGAFYGCGRRFKDGKIVTDIKSIAIDCPKDREILTLPSLSITIGSQKTIVTFKNVALRPGGETGGSDGNRPMAVSNAVEVEIPESAKIPTAMGGGFGGAKPADEIIYPKNWDKIVAERSKEHGIDPNEHQGTAPADPNQMRTEIYDVADLLNPPMNIDPGVNIRERIRNRMEELKRTIVQSIVSESWYENGGEGRIDVRDDSRMMIYQTPQVHEKIQQYLQRLRDDLFKYQIAIEARFILIPDDFPNEFEASIDGQNVKLELPLSNHTVGQVIDGPANSAEILAALEDKPLEERVLPFDNFPILDDLQVGFLKRAIQAHKKTKLLSAPKATVLNGESARMQVHRDVKYVDIDNAEQVVPEGLILDILPMIQNDGEEILLKGYIQLVETLESETETLKGIPAVQVVNVPIHTLTDNGIEMLIVGPEINDPADPAEKKRRLLVLIKPTVIEQEEVEPEPAIGGLAYPQQGGMGGIRFGGGMNAPEPIEVKK